MNFVLFAFFALYLTTETYAQAIPTLPANQVIHDSVELDRWKFYNFSVSAYAGWTLKVVHMVGVAGYNDIDIYVLKQAIPDRGRYTYTDLSLKSEITITGAAESSPTYYIVGIFGFRGQRTYFTISLEFNNGCGQNCNNHGTCSNGVCNCRSGYTGTSCQYTSQSIILGNTYSANVSQDLWTYFTVEIFTANNININVQQTSGEVDLYVQWEKEPGRYEYQYAAYGYFISSYSLSITEPHLGLWYLGFSTYTLTGATFKFNVTETRTCPMRCSLHGRCVGTYCHCDGDYTGLSCEEIRNYVSFQHQYSGFVDQNFWNFYKFVANSENSVDVMLSHAEGADCDLYVNAYSKPTRFVYNYRNISFDPVSHVIVQNPEFSTWWVAIYGVTACEYQLTMTLQNSNNCSCAHGQCVEGVCRCQPGYVGPTCNQQALPLNNGVVSVPGHVLNGQWIYYQISVTSSSQLNVVLQEKNTSGMVWMYIARETSPTLSNYYAADNNSGLPTHRLSLEFPSPQTLIFIIGVYGSPFVTPQGVNFTLVAWYTPF